MPTAPQRGAGLRRLRDPADALVPYAVTGASGLSAEPAAETLEASGSAGHRRRGRGDARRRGRRAHRRRGRALLLTATGVVLALGALSLAELAMEPDGDSGAAEYVSEATSSATEPLPSASSAEHDDPGPVEEPTVVPVTDSHSATATDGPAGCHHRAGALPSPSGPADTTPSAPESSSAPEDPDGTDAPAGALRLGEADHGPGAAGAHGGAHSQSVAHRDVPLDHLLLLTPQRS